MKLPEFLLLAVCLYSSGCFASDEVASDECDYKREAFKFLEVNQKDVFASKWQHTADSETGEGVDRLVISYVNGDVLVVEHKYCVIYNFQATYYSASLLPQSVKLVDRVKLMEGYNFLALDLKTAPADQLSSKVSKADFSSDKPYRLNFDAVDKKGQNSVNYSISYDPLGGLGLMGSVVSVYVAVGGE